MTLKITTFKKVLLLIIVCLNVMKIYEKEYYGYLSFSENKQLQSMIEFINRKVVEWKKICRVKNVYSYRIYITNVTLFKSLTINI